MDCLKCGTANSTNAKFCRNCGSPLSTPSSSINTGGIPRWVRITSITVGAVVVVGGIAGAAYAMGHKPKPVVNAAATTAAAATGPKQLSVQDVIQHALPSTVYIDVTTPDGEDIGSGFVYDTEGDVLTNAHVVEGETNVVVKTHDGSSYTATIIGIDPTHDIAALRVPALTGTAPLPLGNSDSVQLGDSVVAIGNPLGLKDTVTSGIISGQNRDFQIGQGIYHNMLQISAPIAPGNSGGPLIEQSDGKVVGINSAGSTNTSGNIGFAIPINQVKTLADAWAKSPLSQSQIAAVMNNAPDTGSGTNSGTGSADNTSGSASTDGTASFGQSCIEAINAYYNYLGNQDYLDAYNMLSQSMQAQSSYASYMSGYTNTVSENVQNPLIVNSTSDTAEITFTLVAGNQQSDGTIAYAVYHMDYTLGTEDGQIRIKSMKGTQVS